MHYLIGSYPAANAWRAIEKKCFSQLGSYEGCEGGEGGPSWRSNTRLLTKTRASDSTTEPNISHVPFITFLCIYRPYHARHAFSGQHGTTQPMLFWWQALHNQ